MINKYQKKPVVIEAILFDGSHESASEIQSWGGTANIDYNDHGLSIMTLEGRMTANIGDYIIKGVCGEFYPCKPDIFYETYMSL